MVLQIDSGKKVHFDHLRCFQDSMMRLSIASTSASSQLTTLPFDLLRIFSKSFKFL